MTESVYVMCLLYTHTRKLGFYVRGVFCFIFSFSLSLPPSLPSFFSFSISLFTTQCWRFSPKPLFVFGKCMLLKSIREQLGIPAFICPKTLPSSSHYCFCTCRNTKATKTESWLRMKVALSFV